MSANAPMPHVGMRKAGPQPLLQSCQGSGGSTLRSSSLPLHRPGIGPQRCALWVRADADATELQGRRGRVCCWRQRRSTTPAEGSKRIGCTLPGAHRCACSELARGSARLWTARTPARPDFLFSRLISRLECAQLRTGSAVREGPTVACACAQWARSWHVGEAAKEGTAGVEVRTIDTSSSRPGASVSRFPCAQRYALPDRPGGEAGHWDAQRCARSGPTRKPSRCRSCAPEGRRSACNRRPSTCSLTARSAAKRKG